DSAWMSMAVLTLGVLAAAFLRLTRRDTAGQPVLATEGVMISVILLGHLSYSAYRWSGSDADYREVSVTLGNVAAIEGVNAPRFERKRWEFLPENVSGLGAAPPLVHGDDIYVGVSEPVFKRGTLFCLDRSSGKKKWEFAAKDG